jgi:large subunit ribosomal protein L17e
LRARQARRGGRQKEQPLTRSNPYQGHPCHIEIILSTPQSEVARSKDLDNVKTGKTVAAIEA